MMRCVTDCSLPLGHPKQVVYRKLTRAEEAQRKRDQAAALAERQAQAFLALRVVRDLILRATDHLEDERRWATWRQKLRDLPANTVDPEKPRWPKPPAVVSCLADFRSLWPRMDWSPLTKGTP